MHNTTKTSSALLGWSGTATNASRTEKIACWMLRVSSTFLRSKASASMPPTIENTSSGPS